MSSSAVSLTRTTISGIRFSPIEEFPEAIARVAECAADHGGVTHPRSWRRAVAC